MDANRATALEMTASSAEMAQKQGLPRRATADERLGARDTVFDNTTNDRLLWTTVALIVLICSGWIYLFTVQGVTRINVYFYASMVELAILFLGLCSLKWPCCDLMNYGARVVWAQIYYVSLVGFFCYAVVGSVIFLVNAGEAANAMCDIGKENWTEVKTNEHLCDPGGGALSPTPLLKAVLWGGAWIALFLGPGVVCTVAALCWQHLQDFEASHPEARNALSPWVARFGLVAGRLIPGKEQHLACCGIGGPAARRDPEPEPGAPRAEATAIAVSSDPVSSDPTARPVPVARSGPAGSEFKSVGGRGGSGEGEGVVFCCGFALFVLGGVGLLWFGLYCKVLPEGSTMRDFACLMIIVCLVVMIVGVALMETAANATSTYGWYSGAYYGGYYHGYCGFLGWRTCLGYCGRCYSPYWGTTHAYFFTRAVYESMYGAGKQVAGEEKAVAEKLEGSEDVPQTMCGDTCASAGNGTCEDGGADSSALTCALGADCGDCGARPENRGFDSIEDRGCALDSYTEGVHYEGWNGFVNDPATLGHEAAAEECAAQCLQHDAGTGRVCTGFQTTLAPATCVMWFDFACSSLMAVGYRELSGTYFYVREGMKALDCEGAVECASEALEAEQGEVGVGAEVGYGILMFLPCFLPCLVYCVCMFVQTGCCAR
jgi:hypothetical protein